MSTAEDQEILARIGQLAGQINRHKNQQAGQTTAPTRHYHPYYSPSYTSPTSGRGPANFQPRGYRGSKAPSHRHRSLVLNNTSNYGGATPTNPQSAGPDGDSGTASEASASPSWVTKKDRHLQLINPAVYEREAQARSQAMVEAQRQKQRQYEERERTKLLNYVHRHGTVPGGIAGHTNNRSAAAAAAAAAAATAAQYEVVVDGIRFHVAKNGSKLVKVSDNNAPKATPKTAIIGGVKFYRSRNGNMYRHGIIKAQRRSGAVSKVNAPCRIFSMTGSCANGPRCRYIHDHSRVAICRDFLQKGDCINGDACDLSHELSPERTPACLHFAKGNCTNPNCRYTHVQITPGSLVCRPFGIYGYCHKGANCDERHVFECPDFSNTGVCKTKGCKLPHRERASILRKAVTRDAAATADEDAEMEDVSSDEDGESVDSNDVDSDAVDEFLRDDDTTDDAFDTQKEFIQL